MHFAEHDEFFSGSANNAAAPEHEEMAGLAAALSVFDIPEEHLLDPALMRRVTAG